jgi:hypothetical protein
MLMRFTSLGVCLLGGCLFVFSGCGDADDGPEADSTTGVTLSDVDDSEPGDGEFVDDSDMDPSQMLGKEVTIRGEVQEVYDAHTVLLDDDWDDSVLVVTEDPLPTELVPGEPANDTVLQVTGKVAEYNLIEIERETGWDLDPEVEVELEDTERMLVSADATIVNRDE